MEKKCCKAGKACEKKCEKKCERGLKETVGKITEKVPAWLRRVKSELAKLVALIEKLQAAIEKLEALAIVTKLSKKDRENLRLFRRQKKAMDAYRAVLEERIARA